MLFERSADDDDPVALAPPLPRRARTSCSRGIQARRAPQDRGLPPGGRRPRRSTTPPRRTPRTGWRSSRDDDAFEARAAPCSGSSDTMWLQTARQHRVGAGLAASCDRADPRRGDAARRILAEVRRQPSLRVPLDDALGSVLAEDVVSPLDIPAWTNSAMDGYAARGRGRARRLAGAPRCGSRWSSRSPQAGFPPARSAPGECRPDLHRRAAAPGRRQRHPAGGHRSADAPSWPSLQDRDAGTNIRPAGEDIRKGATVLRAGTELGPAQLGVLASLAVAHPLVYRRPRVAILGSGDEIVDVDQPEEILSGRKIASSNTHTLVALVRRAGGEPVNLGIAARHAREPPRAPRTRARLRPPGHDGRDQRGRARLRADGARGDGRASSGSGGSGCGRARRSASACSRPSRGSDFPGNPVSTMVTFELFVRPAIRRCRGTPSRSGRPSRSVWPSR